MIKWEFKLRFTITELHLIFAVILGLHISLMTFQTQSDEYIAVLKEQELKKVAKAKKEEEENASGISSGKYIRRPFVITYLGNIKLKRHSELLELLQGKFNKGPARIANGQGGVTLEKGSEVKLSVSEQQEFSITDEQKKNLIKRLIKERMAGVNVCKQKHLIEDEFLMGTLKVSMKIKGSNNLAVPRFQGHGNRKVISSLESCIKAELVSMSFPTELANQEVTFDLKVN